MERTDSTTDPTASGPHVGWHALVSLRAKIFGIAVAGCAALALLLITASSHSLTNAYRHAGESELSAIASTWNDDFSKRDLSDPAALQRRIDTLRELNSTLHKISVSWVTGGEALLVASGHEHDPDGSERDVTPARVPRASGAKPAPVEEAAWGYREVEAAGAHYGELNYRLADGGGRTIAALELHYDLKTLDMALAAEKQRVAIAAAVVSLLLAAILNLVLGRAVLRPLDRLRAATNQIRVGGQTKPINWRRHDEIGALARDFDRMAHELHEAIKDPLTNLLNHRAFQERLGEELRRAERERVPVSVVTLDIDSFRELNDRFGHAAGDDVLRRLAAALKAELRTTDICGRIGGDVFALALGRSDAHQTEELVGRLRARIAALGLAPGGQPLTLSAGISEFPRHTLSQEELLHLAHGAMYWAKSSGRDRAFVYSAEHDVALSPEEAAERNLRAGLLNTVHALARAVDAKDGYTHSHSQRVSAYAGALAGRLGLDADRVEMIRTAGVLHDVGKIGISDSVLRKPGRLDDDEFAVMKRHSELGRDIIAGAGLGEIATWVYHLHERYAGGGYPSGMSGDQIPLESRILHCADALEAMTSSRVYRTALPLEVALAELERNLGGQFDPEVGASLVQAVRGGDIVVTGDGWGEREDPGPESGVEKALAPSASA